MIKRKVISFMITSRIIRRIFKRREIVVDKNYSKI